VLKVRRAVAVTGIGVVSNLGNDWDSFWASCLNGKAVVEPIPEYWARYYESKSKFWSPLALPNYDLLGLKLSDVLSIDPAALNAMCAAEQAIASSRCKKNLIDERSGRHRMESFDEYRCGTFIGTGLGCITSTFQNYVPHLLSRFRKEVDGFCETQSLDSFARELKTNIETQPRVLPVASTKSMANAISAQIAIRNGLKGPNETCVAACAAGASAIARAYELIAFGKLDFAVAGGTEYYGDRAGGIFMAFDRLNTLAKGEQYERAINRPFDCERTGFLFSQGGACVLALESEESARARGVPILAFVKGSSTNSDAYSVVALAPHGESIQRMIAECLNDAEIHFSDIDYVNAHGTATVQNDELEAAIIDSAFPNKPLVNTTKSLLGHTIGACGAIEAAVSAFSIYSGELHPNLNLDCPIRDLNFVQQRQRADIRCAFTQNFGFGGHNVGLIFARD